jgi:hypothetical protein
MSIIQGGVLEPGVESVVYSQAIGSPALGTATAVHAAIADTGAPQVVTTSITSPDVCRNITATPGGTTANVTAVSVIIAGTDIHGGAITETLPAFSAGAGTAVTGSKAFKTVTSITIPSNGSAVTTSIGVGSKLGLSKRLSRNSVLNAYLGGAKEGTAPTVATSATVNASNTVTLNSALNGTAVVVDFIAP